MKTFIEWLQILLRFLSVAMAVIAVHHYNAGEIDHAIYVMLTAILFAIWSHE